MAQQRRVGFRGRLQPWVSGKDIVLELLRRWGAKQSQGMSVELVDADKQLPIAFRNTIANMMAEAEAMNGIFAPDEITYAWDLDNDGNKDLFITNGIYRRPNDLDYINYVSNTEFQHTLALELPDRLSEREETEGGRERDDGGIAESTGQERAHTRGNAGRPHSGAGAAQPERCAM